MSNEIVPVVAEVVSTDTTSTDAQRYGYYVKRSTLCPICMRNDHMSVNLLRARDFKKYEEISREKSVAIESLRQHFKNHYMISTVSRRIINLKEDGDPEANELIYKIFEGEVDLFSGAQDVLKSKAERLKNVQNRLRSLTERQEIDQLDEFETQELVQLNKLAEDMENSIMKTFEKIDKKLFPMKKEELSSAVLNYKLNILKKMLDGIQVEFLEFENRSPQYKEVMQELRGALANRFNQIEDEILKSGGMLQGVKNS